MPAPERFADWMSAYHHVKRAERRGDLDVVTPYRYHPRSNAVSVRLGEFVAADIYDASANLRERVGRGAAAYSVDQPFLWDEGGEEERIDLAIGIPSEPPSDLGFLGIPKSTLLTRLFVAIEAKAVMTEHIGAKPRLRRELISAHVLTHERDQQAIAAGITIVNVSREYVSPGTQRADGSWPMDASTRNMPHEAESLMEYLRRMRVRRTLNETGFDAYCHVVISTDNIGPCTLVTGPPAPHLGDDDHYATFLARVVELLDRRFP